MSKNNPPLQLLFNHWNCRTTIVYGDWIKIDSKLFHADKRQDAYTEYGITKDYQTDIENALKHHVQVFDLSNIDKLDNDTLDNIANFAYSVARNILNDNPQSNIEMYRQLLLKTKNPKWALVYCRDVQDDAEMRQIIINAGDPHWACWYCSFVKNDAQMRQVIINSGVPSVALEHMGKFGFDADMRQVIVDAGDPKWAYEYCLGYGDDEDMHQIIIDAKDPYWENAYSNYLELDGNMS